MEPYPKGRLLYFRDVAIARMAWRARGDAPLALRLIRKDAALAMEIGNYHLSGRTFGLDAVERAH